MSERERLAARAGSDEGLSEEWAQSEREGSQREPASSGSDTRRVHQ